MRKLIVVGSGGFGREVLDIIRDQKRELLGVTDEYVSDTNLRLLAKQGVSHLGSLEPLLAEIDPDKFEYVIGIGDGPARKRIDQKFINVGIPAATLVHSSATLGLDVQVSPGTIICAGARVTTNVSLGRHVHVNLNATIGHDCTIDSYVTINPGASISGNVTIGEAALIGAQAFVIQKTSIGEAATVGAAAAVTKSVERNTTVIGVPAKPLAI